MNEITVGLWALLEFAMSPPGNLDFQERIHFETTLLNDIFKPTSKGGYDRLATPSNRSLEISPILHVEHMELLDEREQIMVMHGSLFVIWQDDRLAWNRTKYGGISTISKSRAYLRIARMEPFIPKVYATELYSKASDLLGSDVAVVTFTHTGAISTSVKLQVRATCNFKFDEFPRDTQNCSFSLYIPNPVTQVTIEAIGFGYRPTMNVANNVPLSVEKFKFKGLEKRILYFIGSMRLDNPKEYPLSMVRSIAYFNFVFQRRYKYFNVKMAYPVFCIACCTYIFTLFRSLHSVTWLLFSLCFQVLCAAELASELPPDYGKAPRIAVVASMVFAQTVMLIMWRLLCFYYEQRYKETDPVMKKIRCTEYIIRMCIPVFTVYNFLSLFWWSR